MKVSLNWLNQYLNVKLTAEEASDILTRVGLEVEGTETFESLKGGLKGVVTGHVLEKEKHPDADRLSVTKVDTGTGEILQIVCGAPNVAAGQKVIVATVGSVLYPGGEKLEIKRSKIRGVESQGMICAEDELGTGTSHDGIMVLPHDTAIGMSAAEYFQVESDTVLELNITPNRSDAASHAGSARDIAAYLRLSRLGVSLQLPDVSAFKVENNTTPVEVVVENTKDCPRYSGVVISGIEVKPSPAWLQNRLKAIGLKPVNNVVDITNYVLHELGHPLHAFDLAKAGNKIVVRNVAEGTPFVTLDAVERKLGVSDLMICSASEPMCIAGVFGGLESGVTESTKAVFIESAYFNPVSIRKTSKRHSLHTDASFRFERGTDPNITIYALQRAALLIKEIAGGTISSEIVDIYPEKITGPEVEFSFTKLTAISGQEVPEEKVLSILGSLGIIITERNGDRLRLGIPTYKPDVTRDVDVAEEILRVYGYDEIRIGNSLKAVFGGIATNPDRRYKNQLASVLTANGFFEILTNSLSNSAYGNNLGINDPAKMANVENPISIEHDILRNTMLFSGLEVVRHNVNHKRADLKLFEFGKIYFADPEKQVEKPRDKYGERQLLGIWMTGNTSSESWYADDLPSDFYALKGIVTLLLDNLKIPYQPLRAAEPGPLSEKAFSIYGFRNKETPLAVLGLLHHSVTKLFDIRQDVWYAEIDWDQALKAIPEKPQVFADIPKFPFVRRDLALLLDKKVEYQSIRDLAFKADKNILKEVNIFDVYEGKNIPEGKKSYAVSFQFQDKSKTLTDTEIDSVMEKLIRTYHEQLGAEIRS